MPDLGLILGLLAVIAFLAAIGRRLALPDPIVFALGGLVLAFVPGLPRLALPPLSCSSCSSIQARLDSLRLNDRR